MTEPSQEAVELALRLAEAQESPSAWPDSNLSREERVKWVADVLCTSGLDSALRAVVQRTRLENAAVRVALQILYHEHTEGCDGGHDHSAPLTCVECRAADALGLPVPDESQRPSLSVHREAPKADESKR